jgi:hypothetical protein
MSITPAASAKETFTKVRRALLVSIIVFAITEIAMGQSNISVYTSLAEKQCRAIKSSDAEADEICVTDNISPGPKANEAARRAADTAATKTCLKQ